MDIDAATGSDEAAESGGEEAGGDATTASSAATDGDGGGSDRRTPNGASSSTIAASVLLNGLGALKQQQQPPPPPSTTTGKTNDANLSAPASGPTIAANNSPAPNSTRSFFLDGLAEEFAAAAAAAAAATAAPLKPQINGARRSSQGEARDDRARDRRRVKSCRSTKTSARSDRAFGQHSKQRPTADRSAAAARRRSSQLHELVAVERRRCARRFAPIASARPRDENLNRPCRAGERRRDSTIVSMRKSAARHQSRRSCSAARKAARNDAQLRLYAHATLEQSTIGERSPTLTRIAAV